MGLEHLKALTDLEELNLARTRVTDAGLGHLQQLKKLRHLDLQATRVTPAGRARLQKVLPNTLITWLGS
jgi:hypothetical protein